MIETEGLWREYAGRTALDRLTLRIEPGEILGFLGPNGAGKTTTVKILAGLIKPGGGRARVAGFDVVEHPVEVKRRVGYVPETAAFPRPVSSRTYFTARLASVLVYVSVLSLAVSLFPALTFAFWRDLGLAGFVAVTAGGLLANVTATVLVINAYLLILKVVHPERARRAASMLQLGAVVLFYGAFYLVNAESGPELVNLSFDDKPWLWANPAAWFAAWLPVATAETAAAAHWMAAAGASALTVLCVPLATGRLSLDYARSLDELIAAGEPVRQRRRWRLEIPGFRHGEAWAVSLLVRAQFRFDTRFRLAILAMVPLIFFYLLLGLGDGGLTDPFVAQSGRPGGPGAPLYMAIIFIPMTLHGALRFSENWRASWIYFAAPASAVRLVVAAKNFAAVFILGSYLVLLAAVWSYYFERVWHAIVHAIVVGLMAHMLLQVAVMISPGLPFASEPRRAETSRSLFGLFFFGAMIATLISALLPFIYARPPVAATFFSVLGAATIGLEVLLRRRVAAAMADVEFR